MKQCPFCRGEKGSNCHVNTGLDSSKHYWQWFDCKQCKGTGQVTDKHYDHWINSKTIRAERIASGETMIQRAERLGVSVAQVSSMETGRDYKEEK